VLDAELVRRPLVKGHELLRVPQVRRARRLTVRGLWFEEGFDPLGSEGFVDDLAPALEAWRRSDAADEVTLPRTRVGRALARAATWSTVG